MSKIVLIGAGSYVFGRDFIADVMIFLNSERVPSCSWTSTKKDSISPRPMPTNGRAKQTAFENKIDHWPQGSGRRRRLCYHQHPPGGWRAARFYPRNNLEARAGSTADATGPGGIFQGLVQVPALLDIAHDMEKLCPDALLMSYCNPMAINCWGLNDYSKIKNVGLCPNPTGGQERFGRMAGVPPKDVWYTVGGLNHQSWFLEIKYKGEDSIQYWERK